MDSIAKTFERIVTDVSAEDEKDPKLECGICMDAMLMANSSLYTCGHFFHSSCVDLIVKSAAEGEESDVRCPECRKRSNAGFIIKGLLNFDEGWEKLERLVIQ